MKRRAILLLGIWISFIFITSCFVIPFHQFIHAIQGLSDSHDLKWNFGLFWLASWFFIVKGWHATEYAILFFLCATSLRNLTSWNDRKRIGVAFVISVLFAITDEWHQTFVPGRDGCLRDVLIDSGGAAIAAVIATVHSKTMGAARLPKSS